MSWYWWLLLILFVVGSASFGKSRSRRGRQSARPSRRQPRQTLEEEAKAIAAEITTIKQFQALGRKQEAAEARQFEAETDRGMESAAHRADVLRAAMDIAQRTTWWYQYIPELDLYTPKSVLDVAYKVYTQPEKDQLQGALDNLGIWQRLDVWNEPEEPEFDIAKLKRFRSIVESDAPQAAKIKRINKLVENDYEFFGDHFGQPDGMTSGDEWFAMQLRDAGLPLAFELYAEGFTTPNDCLRIDPDDFAKRKGVGTETAEKLREFQERVKENKIGGLGQEAT